MGNFGRRVMLVGGKGGKGVRESFVDMSPCLEEDSFEEFDLQGSPMANTVR